MFNSDAVLGWVDANQQAMVGGGVGGHRTANDGWSAHSGWTSQPTRPTSSPSASFDLLCLPWRSLIPSFELCAIPAQVDTWNIPSGDYYYIAAGNAARPSWVNSKAVSQSTDPQGGATVTTVCFSRPLTAPSAAVSAALQLSDPISMVYAAASDGVIDFGSLHTYRGAFSLNLLTGAATEIPVYSRKDKMNIHGALMAVAWVLLLPLGALMARHR